MKEDQNIPIRLQACPFAGVFALPDDPFLSEIAAQTPAVLGVCLKEIIRANPQSLLTSPSLDRFLRRNGIRGFKVDSVDVSANRVTVGHSEVHSLMLFELREKPTANFPEGRAIGGAATVVMMREGITVFDVNFAEVLRPDRNN